MLPKIAIVYLSFHCEPYVEDLVKAMRSVSYPKDRLALVIVDNPHPEHGPSVPYLEQHVMPYSGKELPEVILLPQSTNTGFSGGNNIGIQWAIDNGYDYVYFHNNDGYVASNVFEPLVEAMEQDLFSFQRRGLLLVVGTGVSVVRLGNSQDRPYRDRQLLRKHRVSNQVCQ